MNFFSWNASNPLPEMYAVCTLMVEGSLCQSRCVAHAQWARLWPLLKFEELPGLPGVGNLSPRPPARPPVRPALYQRRPVLGPSLSPFEASLPTPCASSPAWASHPAFAMFSPTPCLFTDAGGTLPLNTLVWMLQSFRIYKVMFVRSATKEIWSYPQVLRKEIVFFVWLVQPQLKGKGTIKSLTR